MSERNPIKAEVQEMVFRGSINTSSSSVIPGCIQPDVHVVLDGYMDDIPDISSRLVVSPVNR